jgi:hypothetical protein
VDSCWNDADVGLLVDLGLEHGFQTSKKFDYFAASAASIALLPFFD